MSKPKKTEEDPQIGAATTDPMADAAADPAPGPEFALTPPPAELVTTRPAKPKTKPVIGEFEAFDAVPDEGATRSGPAYPWDKLDAGRMFKVRGVAKQGISRSAKMWAEKNPSYTVELRDGTDETGPFVGVYRTA